MKKNKIFDVCFFGRVPSFKETMDFHWCDEVNQLSKQIRLPNGNIGGGDMIDVTRMFCRKSDSKCFVEDMLTKELFEFNGAKASGDRIMGQILLKHKKENKLFNVDNNENISNNKALE